jgi:hypothetical protein
MVLSLVDAGTGIFCYPALTIVLVYDLMLTPKCWIIDVQSRLFRITSILSLSVVVAISVERHFGVQYPLIHHSKITKGKLLLLLLSVWSSCAVVSVLGFFLGYSLDFFATISSVFLLLITMYAHTRIALTVIRSKMKREGLVNGYSNPDARRDNETANKNRMEKLRFLKELKMAKSSFFTVFCYLLCYTPAIVVLAGMWGRLSASTYFLATPWCLLFVMLNSIINSVIFFWRSASLRKETKNVLRNIKMKCIEKIR